VVDRAIPLSTRTDRRRHATWPERTEKRCLHRGGATLTVVDVTPWLILTQRPTSRGESLPVATVGDKQHNPGRA
jgi:hypothetical protein